MRKCIDGRQTGKTQKLLQISAKEQIPIVTTNRSNVNYLKSRAKKEGLYIPDPISIHDLMSENYLRGISEIPQVIVDDAEHVLSIMMSNMCKVKNVNTIAICTNDMSDELI